MAAAALVALWLLYPGWPGAFGLFGPDEPRYASIAREMARSGDWVSPVLDGKPWLEKPALLYWLGAVGFKLGWGPEAAVRVPVGLLSLGFVLWFGWRTRSWERAAMLATCAGWIGYSNIAVTDVPMSVFFAAGMILAAEWVATGRGAWWAGACFGAAILGKGLVPVVLAAPLAWLARERWRDWWKVVVAAIVVAGPWYVLVTWRHGWLFIQEFFIEHHFSRFASGDLQHVQPLWFYVPLLIGMLLPWAPLLWRGAWRERSFYAVWLVFGFVFFSLSKNKLPGYLMPLLPAAVMVMRVPGRRYLLSAAGGMVVLVTVLRFGVLPGQDATLTGRTLAQQVGDDSCANQIPRSLRYGVHYYAGKPLGECWEMPGAKPVPAGIERKPGVLLRVKGGSGSGRLLFFAAPRTTEGDWVVPVEKEPNLVWMGAREVLDWKTGSTIDFDPNEIGFPGSFRGAGAGDWVWNVFYVRNGEILGRSETRRAMALQPGRDQVWETELQPASPSEWPLGRQGWRGIAAWRTVREVLDGKRTGTVTVEAPAPLDFSNFYGIDLTKRPRQIFHDAQGKRLPHPTLPEFTIAEWALQDSVLDPHHGTFGAMEYQFGPATPEGYERPLFHRGTGETDPVVLEHWLQFDLARLFVEKKIDATGITIRHPDASALSFCKKTGARCIVN